MVFDTVIGVWFLVGAPSILRKRAVARADFEIS